MYDFKDKRVLVAGGTGLIGTPLVELLLEKGARVVVASLDSFSRANPNSQFIQIDLLDPENCVRVCRGIDYVFNLLCVKGSPAAVQAKPATFFEVNLLLDVLLLRAAHECDVGGYLLASSLAVYQPAEIFREDSVWSTYPSQNDRYAGWAKRMGELQTQAHQIQYGDAMRISIVRPANTYGPHDDFWSPAAMVVPSLIRRTIDGESPLKISGDGLQVRDFIHASDVARGMIHMAEHEVTEPVNLGSGVGVSIRALLETIVSCVSQRPEVEFETGTAVLGDRKRILDTTRARNHGFTPQITLHNGIQETVDWYRAHRDNTYAQHNLFHT